MTTQEKIIARKYAQAFFRVFGKKITENDMQSFDRLRDFYQNNSDKFFYLYLSSLTPGLKQNLILQTCDAFGLKSLLQPLVTLLAQHGRLKLLGMILQQLMVVYRENHNIMTVRLISAHPLEADEQNIMKKFLEHKTRKTIQLQLVTDPRLIAGVRLQSDTVLWEYSIAQQLRAISSSV